MKPQVFCSQKRGIKPPIGIIPEQIWKENRQQELTEAIKRRMDAGFEIPQVWVEEFNRNATHKTK